MNGLVGVDVTDGVAVVVIDNPPVNALTNDALDALAATARRLAADESVRAVVLTGAGDKAFMAGADLEEFAAALGGTDWILDHTARSRRALDLWARMPQPVVGAVQASALGGGLEVALVCDLLVADPRARLGLPEVKLGLMPGAGGTQRLPRRVGPGRAKELVLLGRTIDAERALHIGLVDRVAEEGAAAAEARALAAELAALPSLSVRAIKQSLDASASADLETGLDAERALFLEVFASTDAGEGVTAFREKRAPRFMHR